MRKPAHSNRLPRQTGFTIVELIVGIAIFAIIAAVALSILAMTTRSRSAALPAAEALRTGSAVWLELDRAVADSASKSLYLDPAATFGNIGPSTTTSAKGSTGPLAGTPPPGSGLETSEHVAPAVFRTGPPLGFGEQLSITGPVTIHTDPVAFDQVGAAVTVLRTDPTTPQLRLGSTFAPGAGRLTLVGREGPAVEAIERLASGDCLLINGLASDRRSAKSLALVTGPARRISVTENAPTVGLDPGAASPFAYFEVPCESSASTAFPWGLRNPQETPDGTDISADAAVAKLAAPWTYYTTDENVLVRLEGAPTTVVRKLPGDEQPQASIVDELATDVASPLAARAVLDDATEVSSTVGENLRDRIRSVRLEIGVRAPGAADPGVSTTPVSVTLDIWNESLRDARVLITVSRLVEVDPNQPPASGYCYFDLNDLSGYSTTIQNMFKNIHSVADLATLPATVRAALWEGFDPQSPQTWWVQCGIGGGGGGK
jgi:prepilin-type N-terminal cleavage/methylation domain-containing protein